MKNSRGTPSLNYTNWYELIKIAYASNENVDDIIVKALEFFEEEYKNSNLLFMNGDAMRDVIVNHMQYHNYYNNLHTQLELITTYYSKKLARLKGRILKEWDDNPPTNHGYLKKDMGYLLEDQDRVKEIDDVLDMFAMNYKLYTKLVDSLSNAGWMISHKSRLLAAGQEEAFL